MLKNSSKVVKALIIIGFAIVSYLLYPALKSLFASIKGFFDSLSKVTIYRADDGNSSDLDIDKTKLSRSTNELGRVTEVVYDLMKGLVNQSGKLTQYLKNYNSADLDLISNLFGRRKYFIGGRSALLGEELTLEGWLSEELKDEDKETLKTHFKQSKVKIL